MADRFDQCLALALQWEGGFVDDPRDTGGATCYGITLSTYRGWADNPELGADDLRNISRAAVSAIYSTNFWNATRSDALPPGVDLLVFDEGVNAGCGRSIRLLQAALGFPPASIDGCIGPVTLAQALKADTRNLIPALADRQMAFYRSLPNFAAFGEGWMSRLQKRLAAATGILALAGALAPLINLPAMAD